MGDMVEAVKRAIYLAIGETGMDMEELALQNGRMFVNGDFDADAVARAAIEAMREPTEGMVRAGILAAIKADEPVYEQMRAAGQFSSAMAARIALGDSRPIGAAFTAMINQALELEGPET